MGINKWAMSWLVAVGAVALTACGGSSKSGNAELRVIHAATNAPAVNLNVNGDAFDAVQGLEYGQATSRLMVRPAVYGVSVDGVLPGGDVTEVVAPVNLNLRRNEITSVVAIGLIGANGAVEFAPEVIVTPKANVGTNETRVQVVHASAAAEQALSGGVSVYVTAPGASLTAGEALTTFNLRETAGPVVVPAGDYRIRIAPGGSTTPVFDSGRITLPGGADLMVLAVDSTGPGSPVKLLVSTGDADSDFFILDRNAPAEVRAVHAASGVGAAEVFASSASLEINNAEVIDAFDYTESEDLADLTPADDYELRINADGGGAVGAPIVVPDVSLSAATYYTVLASGDLGDGSLTAIAAVDDRRSVATEARIRAIHSASQAGTVDVFVTAAGDVTVAAIELGEVTPTISGFEVGDVTDYIALPAGSYDVRVAVPAGGGAYSVAIDVPAYALANGDVVTLVARNPDAGEGLTGFGFIVLED